MKTESTPGLFNQPLSGPEALARLDREITRTKEHLAGLEELRAGLFDLHGMERVALPKTADPVRAALCYFDDKHKQIIHAPACITWGKDNTIMKRIVTQHNGMTERLIDEFFTLAGGADDYLSRVGFTPQSFAAKVPALLARLNGPQRMMGVTRNTQDNSQAATRAAQVIRGITR